MCKLELKIRAMNVSILQMISIVSYSNAYLKDQLPEISNQGEKISMYCNKVLFQIPMSKTAFSDQAPIDWFIALKYREVKEVKLCYLPFEKDNVPEYKTAGLAGGGGVWMVEVVMEKETEYWFSTWEIDKERKAMGDDRFWNVTYRKVPVKKIKSVVFDVEVQSKALAVVLKELIDYCISEQLIEWERVFKQSAEVLKSKKPSSPAYLKDIIVEGMYANEALALMEAADRAFVFGGRDSWSEIGERSSRAQDVRYETLTEKLYITLNTCILAFANSW